MDLTSSVEYIFDQTTTAVFSVIIENVGTKDIEEATSGDNFEVSFVASSDPDPTTADTVGIVVGYIYSLKMIAEELRKVSLV